jgi:hypothetical protein
MTYQEISRLAGIALDALIALIKAVDEYCREKET